MSTQSTRIRNLTVFSLIMITIGSVDSIRNLPTTALFGSSLIFFFMLAGIFFLIPCGLVSAELSSGYPEQGGVYKWVKHAFGEQAGLFAIWFQWIENVFWYPAILSFTAATIGFVIAPHLAQNKYFLIGVILLSFWGATILNARGMKSSARFASFCAIAGLILPMVLIIILGLIWIASGQHLQVNLSWHGIMPNLHDSSMWVALTGIILSCCGIEIATVHARDVNNPQKSFPRALIFSIGFILVTLILGSLAIAIVLPENKISLVAGLMQAFHAFFAAYHLNWLLPIMAVSLVIGSIGGVSNWIIAPTKGLMVAAEDGNMPTYLCKENRHGAPTRLLFWQAVIVTLITGVFLLMPSVNGSYWLLTALTAQLYMLMYLLMFAAAIYLRFKHPDHHYPFKIPGGKLGMSLVAGAGIIGCVTTIVVGFIPPANIKVGGASHYDLLVAAGLLIMSLPPIFLYYFCKVRPRRKLELVTVLARTENT